MGGCGTSRPSTAGFPKELKIPKSEVGKHEYHSTKITVLFDSIFRMAVGFLLWIDNAPVPMMTTVHDLNKTVQRFRKKPGKKSSKAKAALENFEENEYEKEIPIPVCVDDYNHHMGGVDQADQLPRYYDTQIIAFRVWWPVLFWVLVTMICNAYIIYQSMSEVAAMSHKEFRLQCAWGLINAGLSTKAPAAPAASAGSYVTANTVLPAEGPLSLGHVPIHLDSPRVCWLCRYKHREEGVSNTLPQTRWACDNCD
jgi:hypothetical protein